MLAGGARGPLQGLARGERLAAPLGAFRLLLAALVLGGCAGGGDEAPPAAVEPDRVTLQLPATADARFAGYLAADAHGYYDAVGRGGTLAAARPGRTAEQVVADGEAELGIGRLPELLAARDDGADLVNIAQVFARSGAVELARKGRGRSSAKPATAVDVLDRPAALRSFIDRERDTVAATSYDGLAQVLEADDPRTDRRYTLDDLNVRSLEEAGTAMLEDGVFARRAWLADPANREVARRFLEASFRGWIACRDLPEDCLQVVLEHDPPRGESHQRWQLNEVNALIWPSATGIGVLDEPAFERTATIARRLDVIAKPAARAAYRTDIAEEALVGLTDDVYGAGWTKRTVHLLPSGA